MPWLSQLMAHLTPLSSVLPGDHLMTDASTDSPSDANARRLSDEPDWSYLLREYYEMYRSSSAGGSTKIRAHQRLVRGTISKIWKSNPPILLDGPVDKPVCVHLRRALDRGRLQSTATVIRAIEGVAPSLRWLYGYDRVPKHLINKFAYAEVIGPRGPILSSRLILGFVLFAPGCVYPSHAHHGLTESYFCLSGAVSENDAGVYAPGSLIFNPPGHSHRITVDAREPCLLAYAWHGAEEDLVSQKMIFSRAKAVA
jgi:dimethylpropiothetin dethiomethylase